jgi:glycogen synthase
MEIQLDSKIRKQMTQAQFFMLRYETEFTPCTGITAVSRQERRHFSGGITIAPWCSKMTSVNSEKGPLNTKQVAYLDWSFRINGKACRVLSTTDDLPPILFLEVEGRFEGIESPYDVPAYVLKEDTLWFGLAVEELLKKYGNSKQFVWGADWESAPALYLVKDRHLIALTLHNTFDECLEEESKKFDKVYEVFASKRNNSWMTRTALEIGLGIADVITTVNRGFAYGVLHEPIQTKVMAEHLQNLLGSVTGIDNAAFSETSDFAKEFKKKYNEDPVAAVKFLFDGKIEARAKLPYEISSKIGKKVLIVSMGRRVSQKLHAVLVESVRKILTQDPDYPIYLHFATISGDDTSPAKLDQIKKLQVAFPNNVAWTEGRLPYFGELMRAADYNCMPSLYEPHGGAYEGTVIPIARAIDGLAEQICALKPRGEAARMNKLWHKKDEAPTGFLFREDTSSDTDQLVSNLKDLLGPNPSPENQLFKDMQVSLSKVLMEAVRLRRDHPEQYAALVLAAVEKQESTSWDENLNGMLVLMEKVNRKIISRTLFA